RYLNLDVHSTEGKKIHVIPVGAIDQMIIPSDFHFLKPGELGVDSFRLIVGCKSFFAALKRKDKFWKTSTEDRLDFEQNLFVDQGQACLDIKRPGVYSITAVYGNAFVVASESGSNPKTAIGK